MKLKLRHETAGKLLFDAATDFPPEVLLQRPGLFQAILDCIGTPFSDADIGIFSLYSRETKLVMIKLISFPESDPYGCHPIACINSLRIIMRKAEKAYSSYLDGGLVAHSPFPTKDPKQAVDSVDAMVSDNFIQNYIKINVFVYEMYLFRRSKTFYSYVILVITVFQTMPIIAFQNNIFRDLRCQVFHLPFLLQHSLFYVEKTIVC